MLSPNSCIKCARPIAVDSASGVCEECERTANTAAPTSDVAPSPLPSMGVFGRNVPAVPQADTPTERSDTPLPRALLPAAPAGYELLDRLGSGGMGAVYLAREIEAERDVAMKFLHHPGRAGALERFLVELRAVARLDHPNIVRVFASDFLRSDPFFTMEYVDGGSLAKKLESAGRFDPVEAARLTATVTRAVHVAHRAGVVHRDLKPSNILLTADGVPKISDFGLAKRIDRDDALTTASGPLGTPGYMAPEQVRGSPEPAGPATDVYGLGATLYHLLTGRPPFGGLQPDVFNDVLRAPPERPRALRPEIPPGLEAIVLKCLEKKPDRRYPSAEALADDLDRFLNGTPPVAPELTWRRRAVRSLGRHRRGLTWAGVAVLATVLVLVLGAAFQPKDPLKKMQQDLAAGRPVTLIGERGNPAWHQWVLGAPEFIPSPMGDGTCSFESLGWAMADLCPDPMTDHYVLRAEFRQLTSRRARVEPVAVGIYFGRASCPGANGFNAHTFFTVSFFDFPKYPDSPEHARFERFIMIQRPGGLPNPSSAWLKSTPFDQAEQLPGPWRAIELEVTPERVRASWPGKDGKMAVFADFTAEKMRAEYAKLNEHLHHPTMPRDHGIVLPDWNPRMPLGIFSARAAISVRNVTLTPQK